MLYFIDHDFKGETLLGVFLYGEKIYLDNVPIAVQAYKFRVYISTEDQFFKINKTSSEFLEFIYTCNLSKYTRTINRKLNWLGAKLTPFKKLDWENLIKDAEPAEYEEILSRLHRKQNKIIPHKVVYNAGDYGLGCEFFEFTEDTASSWAGPFKQNGKLGALVLPEVINKQQGFPVFDVKKYFSYYDLPYNFGEKLDTDKQPEFPNGDYFLCSLTEEEKINFFDNLPLEVKHATAQNYYSKLANKERIAEYLGRTLPYKIYMYGTDDCSYTKWFISLEEVERELNYLRTMQPLNFNRDIMDREYIFTN